MFKTTNSILDEIFTTKTERLASQKRQLSLQDIQNRLRDQEHHCRDFAYSLTKRRFGGDIALIAEIKKASPSKGLITTKFEPNQQAWLYNKGGADAISILTEQDYFQGQIDFIPEIREVTEVPLLRKDFIFDPYQLYETKLYQADATLLIASALETELIVHLLNIAYQLDLDIIVETHTAQDIEKALKAQAPIIGINARNLHDFSENIQTIQELAPLIPSDVILVAESSIKNRQDVLTIHQNTPAQAILVGASLMKHPHPDIFIHELKGIRD